MMKIFIPRNISGSRRNITVNLGPASISIIQLMILAIGLGGTIGVWNTLQTNGVGKGTALVFSLPLFLICIFIAFFKYSELTLLPFIAKMIRTHFLDTTRKFQINRDKPDPKAIALAKSRKSDHDIVIEQKDLLMDTETLNKLKLITEQS